MTKSLALNYSTLCTCLGSIACCVCPNVIITAKASFASIAPVVAIFVCVTKLCNNLCVCVFSVVSTCVCSNTCAITSRSCCYFAGVVMCISVNGNNFCISIAASTSECLKTFSCTSRSSSYFFCVFTNVNTLNCELTVSSNCYLVCTTNNNLNIAVLCAFLEVRVSGEVCKLEFFSPICISNLKVRAYKKFNDSRSIAIFVINERHVCAPVVHRATNEPFCLCRIYGSHIGNSFISLCLCSVTVMTYPVCETIINKVCSLSCSVIEDDVKTFNGFKLERDSEPSVLTFNSSHSCAGPRLGNRIYEPSIKVYVIPFSSIIINGNIYLSYGRKLINYFCFCFAANGAGACLKTGSIVCGLNSYFPITPSVTKSGNNFLRCYDRTAVFISANFTVSKTGCCACSCLTGNNGCVCVLAINVALKSTNVTVGIKVIVVGMSLNRSFCLFNQCSVTNRAFRAFSETCRCTGGINCRYSYGSVASCRNSFLRSDNGATNATRCTRCKTCGSTGSSNCRYSYGSMISCRNSFLCLKNHATNVTMRAFSETCGGTSGSNSSISCYYVPLG